MNTTARNAYLGASVTTASPERLLLMLCDRLVLDLNRGRDAQVAGDRAESHAQLLHAQEILLELRSSLKIDAWVGADQLDNLYGWMHRQLVTANIRNDAAVTEHVLSLAIQLNDAWRDAALQTQVAS